MRHLEFPSPAYLSGEHRELLKTIWDWSDNLRISLPEFWVHDQKGYVFECKFGNLLSKNFIPVFFWIEDEKYYVYSSDQLWDYVYIAEDVIKYSQVIKEHYKPETIVMKKFNSLDELTSYMTEWK